MNAFASFLSGVVDGVEQKERRESNRETAVSRGLSPGSKQDSAPQGSPDLRGLIDAREGDGDYGTLFGYAQRDGGRFAGVDVTGMTLGELYRFTDPSGEYGQWVKEKNGDVATPVGRYQIVGTTLRDAAKSLGLPEDTRFTPQVQDQMFSFLAQRRLAAAGSDQARKVEQIRNEWAGLRGVPDDVLARAISSFEAQQGRGLRPQQGVSKWQ